MSGSGRVDRGDRRCRQHRRQPFRPFHGPVRRRPARASAVKDQVHSGGRPRPPSSHFWSASLIGPGLAASAARELSKAAFMSGSSTGGRLRPPSRLLTIGCRSGACAWGPSPFGPFLRAGGFLKAVWFSATSTDAIGERHRNVGPDSDLRVVVTEGRIELGGCQSQPGTVRHVVDALNAPFSIGLPADDDASVVVADRPGDNFAGTGAIVVHQEDERHVVFRVGRGRVRGVLVRASVLASKPARPTR